MLAQYEYISSGLQVVLTRDTLLLLLFLVFLANVDFGHGELLASASTNFAKCTFQTCGNHNASYTLRLDHKVSHLSSNRCILVLHFCELPM